MPPKQTTFWLPYREFNGGRVRRLDTIGPKQVRPPLYILCNIRPHLYILRGYHMGGSVIWFLSNEWWCDITNERGTSEWVISHQHEFDKIISQCHPCDYLFIIYHNTRTNRWKLIGTTGGGILSPGCPHHPCLCIPGTLRLPVLSPIKKYGCMVEYKFNNNNNGCFHLYCGSGHFHNIKIIVNGSNMSHFYWN